MLSHCSAAGSRVGTHLCPPQLILGAVVESYEEQSISMEHLAILYRSIGRGVADYTETKVSPFMKPVTSATSRFGRTALRLTMHPIAWKVDSRKAAPCCVAPAQTLKPPLTVTAFIFA